MAQIGVLRSENPKIVEAGLPALTWTIANMGSTPWEHVSLTLYTKSDAVRDAPQQIDVPLLQPGQTAEVGTQVLVASGQGDAEVAYLLEVWSGEEGALTCLNFAAPVAEPQPALSAQVVYIENAADLTAENATELKAAGVQQVLGVAAERHGVVQALLRNNGAEAWPQGCALQLVVGDGTERIEFHAVQPGEMVHVALGNISDCRWVMHAPDGTVFGPLLQVVQVAAEPKEGSPSEGWEKVEEPTEPEQAELPEVEAAKQAMLLGCTVLNELGFVDNGMNAYLLQAYDYDLCKVCAILQGHA